MALPLYEGRMIGQFDFSQKGWVSGKGRSAVWRDIPWERKVIEPQYLMGAVTIAEQSMSPVTSGACRVHGRHVGHEYADGDCVGRRHLPCGNSAPVLECRPIARFRTPVCDVRIRLRSASSADGVVPELLHPR